ncbi:MAG: M20/M25/M40 family metallo-hydrolase [Chloroflexi bacterium]|nr:M20/M25/M40 family metallo-hydrolase [Chloroflexota bacterium]
MTPTVPLAERYKQRVLDVLRDLIRLDTTNPPGNETAAARYLADLLAPAGIETEVVESAPGRGNLIARLRGTGEAQPLLLMGHLDVVAADPAEWRYPPFAAEVHDGFVWGRGATDMKNMVAACAVAMLALAEAAPRLKRDVLFMATADEEHGGRMGMGWLARERRDLFDVACALNEGGGDTVRVGGRVYYTCQTAEKGVCRTVWTAHGPGGHGARPRGDIATQVLARALAGLGDGHLNRRVAPTMAEALRLMAADVAPAERAAAEEYLANEQAEEALRAVGFDRTAVERTRSLFYDTVSVTGLRAGDPESINVITATATAYTDGRILPGQTDRGLLQALRERADGQLDVEVYRQQYSPGLEAPADAPMFRLISQVVGERCDGARVVPWMCAGSTDAKHLAPLGVPVYGFVPSPALPEGLAGAGAHAVDERLWIESLPFTVSTLHEIVYRFCA